MPTLVMIEAPDPVTTRSDASARAAPLENIPCWRLPSIRRLAGTRGLAVRFEAGHGKGSHGRLYLGTAFTALKDRRQEVGPGPLRAMLRQLGLSSEDLKE